MRNWKAERIEEMNHKEEIDGKEVVITTDHSASSYGHPVMTIDGDLQDPIALLPSFIVAIVFFGGSYNPPLTVDNYILMVRLENEQANSSPHH